MCFEKELSTKNQRTLKIAFWTFFPKYLQLTISTRDLITKPRTKYIFTTAFNAFYNGVRQLYYI